MSKIAEEFVSNEKKDYKWKIGVINASSLSGFIAGFLVAAVFFLVVFDIAMKQ
jgi:tetrahydromethanopterin S-methyltransferase subunit F